MMKGVKTNHVGTLEELRLLKILSRGKNFKVLKYLKDWS